MTKKPSRSTRRLKNWAVAEPSERDIQAAVLEHWKAAGTPGSLVAAVPNAGALGQAGLTAGLFDLVVMSRWLGDKTGWLELKRESRRNQKNGGLSDAQSDFMWIIDMLNIPHAVAYGRDEPIEVLRRWGAIR